LYFYFHSNAILNINMYSCISLGLKITQNKIPRNVVDDFGNWINFVRASAPCTHAWTHEKNRLILIIIQCNTEHKNIFLHIPGLKITQINIPRNVVDIVLVPFDWTRILSPVCFLFVHSSMNFCVFDPFITRWMTSLDSKPKRLKDVI
jgi:hypothetical protein